MLHYALFGRPGNRLGVALNIVPNGTNAIEMFVIDDIVNCPRQMPIECLPLFAPKLKQEHMPSGVDLERLKALACELLRQGWHEAEEAGPEGMGVPVPIGRLAGEHFADLADILRICDEQPEDAAVHLTASKEGLCFRPRRVRMMLSRLRTEGQIAYKSCPRNSAVA